MKYSTNYGYKLPEGKDELSPDPFNENFESIDNRFADASTLFPIDTDENACYLAVCKRLYGLSPGSTIAINIHSRIQYSDGKDRIDQYIGLARIEGGTLNYNGFGYVGTVGITKYGLDGIYKATLTASVEDRLQKFSISNFVKI